MQKKRAGFWIRFLAGLIDSIIFVVLGVATSLAILDQNKQIINYGYYIWLFGLILILVIFQIIVPLLSNGRATIGRLICRLEVRDFKSQQKPALKIFLKKEIIYTFLWIIGFFLVFLFISPELFQKIANTREGNIVNNENFTNQQVFLIFIPTSIIGLSNFLQSVATLSIIRNSRRGINDIFSGTETVYKNKYIKNKSLEKESQITTRKRKTFKIEWVD
ncbi:RDD family protein [Candidatus Mycoplasma pogonae]